MPNQAPMQQSLQALQGATQMGQNNPGVNAIGALMTAAASKTAHRPQVGSAPRGPGGSGIAAGIDRASAEIGQTLRQRAAQQFTREQQKSNEKFQMEHLRVQQGYVTDENKRQEYYRHNLEFTNEMLKSDRQAGVKAGDAFSFVYNHMRIGGETLQQAQQRGAPGNPMQYTSVIDMEPDPRAAWMRDQERLKDPRYLDQQFRNTWANFNREVIAHDENDPDSFSVEGHVGTMVDGKISDTETTEYGHEEGQSIDIIHNVALSPSQRAFGRINADLGDLAFRVLDDHKYSAMSNKFHIMQEMANIDSAMEASFVRSNKNQDNVSKYMGVPTIHHDAVRNELGQITANARRSQDYPSHFKEGRTIARKGLVDALQMNAKYDKNSIFRESEDSIATKIVMAMMFQGGAGDAVKPLVEFYMEAEGNLDQLSQQTNSHIPHGKEGKFKLSPEVSAVVLRMAHGLGVEIGVMGEIGSSKTQRKAYQVTLGIDDKAWYNRGRGLLADEDDTQFTSSLLSAIKQKLDWIKQGASGQAVNVSMTQYIAARSIDISSIAGGLMIEEGYEALEAQREAYLRVVERDSRYLLGDPALLHQKIKLDLAPIADFTTHDRRDQGELGPAVLDQTQPPQTDPTMSIGQSGPGAPQPPVPQPPVPQPPVTPPHQNQTVFGQGELPFQQ